MTDLTRAEADKVTCLIRAGANKVEGDKGDEYRVEEDKGRRV